MAIAYSNLALPKPRPVKRMRAKPKPRARVKPQSAKAKKEAALVGKVFREIEGRDGHCRMRYYDTPLALAGECGGESQPAHLAQWRRSKTRGLPPEERHNGKTIIRLCADHHRRYDQHKFDLAHTNWGGDGYIKAVPYVKGAL